MRRKADEGRGRRKIFGIRKEGRKERREEARRNRKGNTRSYEESGMT
jgi:hypothetical protein